MFIPVPVYSYSAISFLQEKMGLGAKSLQRELFQQENVRPHTARLAMDYLEQNNIIVLPWPSKSPDLNPIKHLWDHLDKRVHQRQPAPQTLDQLCQILEQEWRTIPINNIRELIESMPRRCRAVLVPVLTLT
jgi:transposase